MKTYQDAIDTAIDLFAKDNIFAMATSNGQVPSVRMVDAYLEDGAFYLVTHSTSRKVQEIEVNPNVSLSKEIHRFFGSAVNLGHPFAEGNEDIKAKIAELLPNRFFDRLDPNDDTLTIIRVDLTTGFFYKDGLGYDVNFTKRTLETYEMQFDMNM